MELKKYLIKVIKRINDIRLYIKLKELIKEQ